MMSNASSRFVQYINSVRPSWQPQQVKLTQIMCALSNKVYCASHGDQKVLLRIYGSTEHGLFTREDEVQQSSFLGNLGFGPKVLYAFEEGRIETWVDGRTPSNEAMRKPAAIRQVAKKLRALHEEAGVNHNDLHRNNMLFSPDGNVELLDFEYSGPADPTYDIANHFNEWMYPYEGEDQHIPRIDLYPNLVQRRDFCSEYLKLGDARGKGAVLEDFLEQVERRRDDSHLFWIDWAERTPNEFNDKYAQARRELVQRKDVATSQTLINSMNHGWGALSTFLRPEPSAEPVSA